MHAISHVTNHKSLIFFSLPGIEVGFSTNLYEVNEDDGTAIFTIQRRGILQRSASINFFAISGEGYDNMYKIFVLVLASHKYNIGHTHIHVTFDLPGLHAPNFNMLI